MNWDLRDIWDHAVANYEARWRDEGPEAPFVTWMGEQVVTTVEHVLCYAYLKQAEAHDPMEAWDTPAGAGSGGVWVHAGPVRSDPVAGPGGDRGAAAGADGGPVVRDPGLLRRRRPGRPARRPDQ